MSSNYDSSSLVNTVEEMEEGNGLRSVMSSEPNTKRLQLILYIKKNIKEAGDSSDIPSEAVFKRVDMSNRKDGNLLFDQTMFKKNKHKKKNRANSMVSDACFSCDSALSDDALIN